MTEERTMKAEDVPQEWVEQAVVAASKRPPLPYDAMRHALAAVIPLVQAAEREACAVIADKVAARDPEEDDAPYIAAAIRARKPA